MREPAQGVRPPAASAALRAGRRVPLSREQPLYRGIGRCNEVGKQEHATRFEARGHVPVEPAFLRIGEMMDDEGGEHAPQRLR